MMKCQALCLETSSRIAHLYRWQLNYNILLKKYPTVLNSLALSIKYFRHREVSGELQ